MATMGGRPRPHFAEGRSGDSRGEQLLDRILPYVPQLRGHLQHRWPSGEADDIVQDVLLRLLQCTLAQTVEFPKSYLFRVANAVIIDRRRGAASRRARWHHELTDATHPSDELSPLRILLAREQAQAAQTVLESLPARTREIILARRLESTPVKSLAAHYGISISAIEKHLRRATLALGNVH